MDLIKTNNENSNNADTTKITHDIQSQTFKSSSNEITSFNSINRRFSKSEDHLCIKSMHYKRTCSDVELSNQNEEKVTLKNTPSSHDLREETNSTKQGIIPKTTNTLLNHIHHTKNAAEKKVEYFIKPYNTLLNDMGRMLDNSKHMMKLYEVAQAQSSTTGTTETDSDEVQLRGPKRLSLKRAVSHSIRGSIKLVRKIRPKSVSESESGGKSLKQSQYRRFKEIATAIAENTNQILPPQPPAPLVVEDPPSTDEEGLNELRHHNPAFLNGLKRDFKHHQMNHNKMKSLINKDELHELLLTDNSSDFPSSSFCDKYCLDVTMHLPNYASAAQDDLHKCDRNNTKKLDECDKVQKQEHYHVWEHLKKCLKIAEERDGWSSEEEENSNDSHDSHEEKHNFIWTVRRRLSLPVQSGLFKHSFRRDRAYRRRSSGNFGSAGPRSAPSTPQGQLGAPQGLSEPLASPTIQRSPSHSVFNKVDKTNLKLLSSSTPAMTAQGQLAEPPSPKAVKDPKVHTTSKARQKKFLRHFPNVEEDEKVLNHYSCALIGDILLQGHLYITKNYFAFYSNVFGYVTKLLIPILTVEEITKEKTARIIPNAVGITTSEDKHIFGSLMSRDNTLAYMRTVWEKAKSEEALPEPEITEHEQDSSESAESGRDTPPLEAPSGSEVLASAKFDRIKKESIRSQNEGSLLERKGSRGFVRTLKDAISEFRKLPRQSLILVATTLLLILLFLSAAVLLYRINKIQNKYSLSLQGTSFSSTSKDIYSDLLQWQTNLHSKSADAVNNLLDNNLDQIAKVRQSLEALSTLLMGQKPANPFQEFGAASSVPVDTKTKAEEPGSSSTVNTS